MNDLRVAGLATLTTAIAIADTALPTPEDLAPILGWVDEVALWGLSAKLWLEYFKGTRLEDLGV